MLRKFPQRTLIVPYESVAFPQNTISNEKSYLDVTWNDILWSAVTVGRPGWFHVFRHGRASIFEAIFRWALIKMALTRSRYRGPFLTLTEAVKNMDQTERGMLSYSFGMTFCKMFSAKLLDTPWLLHLDVFRHELKVVVSGRSRPDLIGQDRRMHGWHGFECKGTMGALNSTIKRNAKAQAQRVCSVGASQCLLHVGAITYFQNDILRFFWCDPPPEDDAVGFPELPDDVWGHYYRPVAAIITQLGTDERDSGGNLRIRVEQCDLEVGVHSSVESSLVSGEWQQARLDAIEAEDEIREQGFQADGIQIYAGDSWDDPYDRIPQEAYR